jgi:hypothetical protein
MGAEFFEHGGEPSGFIQGGEFRDQHGLGFPKLMNTLFFSFIS